MAREEIKLVGSFKDDITPKLQKLNREITNIGRSFERFNKKISPVTKNFAKMAMSAKEFSAAMGTQRTAIESSARAMREYSKQAGKMSGAMRKVTDARMKSQRQMGVSRAQARKGGGSLVPADTAGGGKGGGSAFGASAGASFTKSVGAIAIGSAIGNMASQAIMGGVRGFANLLKAPFDKFLGAFKERIGDEMDDIKSAGGLFALDMDLTQESGNERFFKNYNESLRYQEKLNIDMAQSAAALPGVTSQYVSTSRQLTDTIQMVMEKDRESFNKMAARYGADISMGGVDASKNAMQAILKKQTEQVVLQSQGQMGGLPMHIAIQQLMGKEAKNGKIGIQAFTNKFRAAFQKNPLLKNFLLRAEEDLAKTDAGSTERLQKLIEVFDAAMPKEVINKMRGSISGMQEALRSGLMDPQAGLFGLSRAVFADINKTSAQFIDNEGKLLKKNVDDFGNFIFKFDKDFRDTAGIAKELGIQGSNLKGQEVTLKQLEKLGLTIDKNNRIIDEQGKVYGEISKSNTYLFEVIREILAGFGPPLLELVGFLPALFDPFTSMTTDLMSLRDSAQKFVAGFNANIDIFEEIAQQMAASKDAAEAGLGNTLKQQSRGRAAIGRFVKFLEGVGGIDKKLGGDILDTVGDVSKEGIQGYDKKITQFIEPLFKAILDSDFVKQLSKGFGQIVGGIIKIVYEMMTGAFSLAEGGAANGLVQGFTEGFGSVFEDLGGFEAIIPDIQRMLSAAISKFFEIAFSIAIPITAQALLALFKGLFDSGPIGKVITAFIAAFAVAQVASVVGTLITAISAISAVLAPIAAPALAFIGIALAVFALFRHMEFILDSFVQALAFLSNNVQLAGVQLIQAFVSIAKAIINKLGPFRNLPGIKQVADGIEGFSNGLDQASRDLQGRMTKNLEKIGQNTADSLQRTSDDFATATSFITGFGGALQQTTQALTAEAEARKHVTAFSLNNQEGGKSTYSVGGMKYDAATGLPTSSIAAGATYGGASAAPVQNNIVPTTPAVPIEEITKPIIELKAPIDETKAAMETMKVELPPAIDTSIKSGVEPAVTAMSSMEATVTSATAQIVAALTTNRQDLVKIDPSQLPLRVNVANAGAIGGGPKVAGPGHKGFFPMYDGNFHTAAGGMNLGSAIATEMKHKPAGSDLVIANSSETIIPANMSVGSGGGGQSITVGDINVVVSGADNPKEIANMVAEELMTAIQDATYREIFTN